MGSPKSEFSSRVRLFDNLVKFFVCPKIPFVGSKIPLLFPSVGTNIPLVRNAGFTLTEMIITVAVVAILLSVGYPTMQIFMKNQRLVTQVNDILTDLAYARSEAIRRSATVSICASSSGTACGGGWESGRLTFVDVNGNGNNDAGDAILRYREVLEGTNTLKNSAGATFLTFAGNGTTGAVEFNLCDDRLEVHGKQLTINSLGQARVAGISPLPAGSC